MNLGLLEEESNKTTESHGMSEGWHNQWQIWSVLQIPLDQSTLTFRTNYLKKLKQRSDDDSPDGLSFWWSHQEAKKITVDHVKKIGVKATKKHITEEDYNDAHDMLRDERGRSRTKMIQDSPSGSSAAAKASQRATSKKKGKARGKGPNSSGA